MESLVPGCNTLADHGGKNEVADMTAIEPADIRSMKPLLTYFADTKIFVARGVGSNYDPLWFFPAYSKYESVISTNY